ncbi:MAG: hypothetical protein AAFY66_05735 [Pseudomonadota bacterium]
MGRHGPALLYGGAGLVGGMIAVLIGPTLGLDDGPDAWLTPLLSGGVGYAYGWYSTRPAPSEEPERAGEDIDPEER